MKEEAEGVAAQLAVEVAQLKKGVEGLQTLVSTREDEARGKGGWSLALFFLIFSGEFLMVTFSL